MAGHAGPNENSIIAREQHIQSIRLGMGAIARNTPRITLVASLRRESQTAQQSALNKCRPAETAHWQNHCLDQRLLREWAKGAVPQLFDAFQQRFELLGVARVVLAISSTARGGALVGHFRRFAPVPDRSGVPQEPDVPGAIRRFGVAPFPDIWPATDRTAIRELFGHRVQQKTLNQGRRNRPLRSPGSHSTMAPTWAL